MNKKIRQKTSKGDVAISLNRERSALIISEEIEASNLIGAVLRNLGYQTKSCDSIKKAYKSYNNQSLVVFYSTSSKETIIEFFKKFNHKKNHEKVTKYLVIGSMDSEFLSRYADFNISSPLNSNEFLEELVEVDRNIFDSKQSVTGNWGFHGSSKNQSEDKKNPPNTTFEFDGLNNAQNLQTSHEELDDVVIKWGKGSARTRIGDGKSINDYSSVMLHNCPTAMAIFDSQSRVISSNQSWKSMVGNPVKDAEGFGQFEYLPKLSKSWRLLCNECLQSRKEQVIEEKVKWINDTAEWIRWHIRPWIDDAKRIKGYTISFYSIDIEKQYKFKRSLEDDSTQAILSSLVIPVLFLDQKGRVIRSNRAAKQFGAWDPIKDEGDYYWDIFLDGNEKELSKSQFAGFSQSLREKQKFNFPDKSEDVILDCEGNYHNVIWSNSPKRDSSGKIDGMIRLGVYAGIFSEMPNSYSTNLKLLDMIPVPAWRSNSSGLIDQVNKEWVSVFGETAKEEVGKEINELLDPEEATKFRELILYSLDSDTSFEGKLSIKKFDGEKCDIKIFGRAVKDSSGDYVYGVAYKILEDQKLDSANQRAARFEAELVSSRLELDRVRKKNSQLEDGSVEFLNISNILPTSIVVLTIDGKIRYANFAALEMMGSNLLEYVDMDQWLDAHLVVGDNEEKEEIIARWNSLVWSRGVGANFSVTTESCSESVFEFKPCIMEQGGLVLSVLDVTSRELAMKSSSVEKSPEIYKFNFDIFSDIFSDYDKDSQESTEIIQSRIYAIKILELFLEELFDKQYVRFGDYCSHLLKKLIQSSPIDSNPEVHLYFYRYGDNEAKSSKQKVDSSYIMIPLENSISLALIISGVIRNVFQNARQDKDDLIIDLSISIDNENQIGEISIIHDGDFGSSGTFSDNFFGDQLKFIGSMIEKINGSLELSSDLINEVSIEFSFG